MANYKRRETLKKRRERQSGPVKGRQPWMPLPTDRIKLLRQKRFRGLVRAFVAGINPIGKAELALARSAAAITLQLEDMQATMIDGEPVTVNDRRLFMRLTNTVGRLSKQLRDLAPRKPAGDAPSVPSLGSHLARLAQRKAAMAAPLGMPN
jgi:hypothetical protein